MSLNYKADGTLDMRFNSSKAHIASGGSYYGPTYSGPSRNSRPLNSYIFLSSVNYSSNINNGSSNNANNDNYHYKQDGTFDMRYKSSKSCVSSNGQNYTHNCSTSSKPVSRNSKVHTKQDATPAKRHKKSTLYTNEDIILNQDGSINKNSRAVQSGEIRFCKDQTIDRRCSAVRGNKIILDSEGNINSSKMGLEKRQNPEELGTKVLRHPYEQQKYRAHSRSKNKEEQHACHKIDLEVAKAILSTKPGTHLTEERLHEDMKPLNRILRMRSRETNMEYDKDMAQRIIKLVHGEDITITRELENKINQMKESMNQIPQEKMNSSLRFIKKKLNNLSKQCQ